MPKGVYKKTDEHKEKLSKANKGQIPWRKGIHLSEEIKKKLSDSHKGQIPWIKGKHHSEESRKKIGLAALGRVCSESTKEKLKLARLKRKKRLGYVNSLEAREKLSKALKGRIFTPGMDREN